MRFDAGMTNSADRRGAKTTRTASQRVCATERAVDAIVHLHAQLGSLVLRHVAGSEGPPEVRLVSSSAAPGADDICLGTVGGVPFLIDRGHDLALGCPDFIVDATPAVIKNDDDGVHAADHLVGRAVRRAGAQTSIRSCSSA
jgi:uncharacterized protein (DUF779 family)